MTRSGFSSMLLTGLLIVASGCGSTSFIPTVNSQVRPGTGFVTRTADLNGRERGYTIFIPENYTPAKSWPTILFIHGYLAGGTDGVRPVSQGLGEYISHHPKDFPF